MDEQTARREIVNIGRLLYERSYVVSSDGNVSVRLDDGRIVATPTMICKGRMTEDLIAVTDLEGKQVVDMAVFNLANLREKLSTSYSRTRYGTGYYIYHQYVRGAHSLWNRERSDRSPGRSFMRQWRPCPASFRRCS